MFALRTAGSAGRSTFSCGVNALRGPGMKKRYSLGGAGTAPRPRRALRAGREPELPLEQLVGLLAVAAPRDPALRVDHVEGREVAHAVRLRDLPALAVLGEGDRGRSQVG